jgi:phospholipid/cholesterol/gamma-HCH transport system substrate-binding protein
MKKTAQWQVGLLIVLSLAILLGTLLVTGSVQFFSGQKLLVDFSFAGPIKTGATVRVSGIVVGRVEKVEFLGGKAPDTAPEVMVRVHCRVEEKASHLITAKARYYVTTLGVLGEHYLDIEPGQGGVPLGPGARVRGVDLARADLLLPRAAAFMELMRDLLDEGRPEVSSLMAKVSDVLKRLDHILSSEETKPVIDNIALLVGESREVLDGFQTVVGDGRALRDSLKQAQRVMTRSETIMGQMEEMQLPALSQQGQKTLDNADIAIETLQKRMLEVEGTILLDGKRQADLAKTFEKTFWELEEISKRATVLLVQLEKGEGALGKAFQDEQLISDLKAVLSQIRRNPTGLLLPSPFKSTKKPSESSSK